MGTMVPTLRFRFVEREIDPYPDEDLDETSSDARLEPVLVLQQWMCFPGSDKGDWYDVPVEEPTVRNWR